MTANPSAAKPVTAELPGDDRPTVESPRVELDEDEPAPAERGVTASATASGPAGESGPPKAPAEQ